MLIPVKGDSAGAGEEEFCPDQVERNDRKERNRQAKESGGRIIMNERQYNVRSGLGKSKERHGWKGKKKRRFEEGPKSKSPIKTTT